MGARLQVKEVKVKASVDGVDGAAAEDADELVAALKKIRLFELEAAVVGRGR